MKKELIIRITTGAKNEVLERWFNKCVYVWFRSKKVSFYIFVLLSSKIIFLVVVNHKFVKKTKYYSP